LSGTLGCQLADVNVLLALLWPPHVHHTAAQAWFAAQGHRSWATNSFTQIGVVRLLTNPAVTQGAVSPSTAIRTLEEATRHPHHEFWPLDRNLPQMLTASAGSITGHRQWTDLLLLHHAVERQAKLVTFDAGISVLAGKALRPYLHILRA
jgi:toxin-antitoxin system PIN domain toxin